MKTMIKPFLRRLLGPHARTRIEAKLTGNQYDELADAVAHMARTGAGTNACLAKGALPMQVHFYSPVPDLKELESQGVWDRKSEMPGVDFRPQAQLQLLAELGRAFGNECDWPLHATKNPGDFYIDNNCFSYGCAAALHAHIRKHKPARVIEAGSGFSSRVISAALQKNQAETGWAASYTIIDPYPGEVVRKLPSITNFVQDKVEKTSLQQFCDLRENDVLFVDSGHTVRIGGDVNFLILEVLPRLAPGVVVHFHDIPMPYEYPKVYATNPAFRVFWTESYLLQAFLACNRDFEILLAMQYLMTEHLDAFSAAFPKYDRVKHKLTSGSLWLRRVK